MLLYFSRAPLQTRRRQWDPSPRQHLGRRQTPHRLTRTSMPQTLSSKSLKSSAKLWIGDHNIASPEGDTKDLSSWHPPKEEGMEVWWAGPEVQVEEKGVPPGRE